MVQTAIVYVAGVDPVVTLRELVKQARENYEALQARLDTLEKERSMIGALSRTKPPAPVASKTKKKK